MSKHADFSREMLRPDRNRVVWLMAAAILSGIATYALLTSSEIPFVPDSRLVQGLIGINLLLLLALGYVVVRSALKLWRALRTGAAGTRLQKRIIGLFSLITVVPTLIVSIFSALFFNYGIQAWFDEKVSTALQESVTVAEAYLQEHKEMIRQDAIEMANDVEREIHLALTNPSVFNQGFSGLASLRSLSEAILFQGNRILAQSRFSFSIAFDRLEQDKVERANQGDVVVFSEGTEKVRALIKVGGMQDTYLLIGRLVDSKVLGHMDTATGAFNEYKRLQEKTKDLQTKFLAVFMLVALMLLMVAVWYGMYFAAQLAIPIARLINAAERVSRGDFSARIQVGKERDEIGTLGNAFNQMTSELEQQRGQLIAATRQMDARARFTEAVLAGVSAGVIALRPDMSITLANRSALTLLGIAVSPEVQGRHILDILPDLKTALEESQAQPEKTTQCEITVQPADKTLSLHVRITAERFADEIEGFIITFDDITELMSAQRKAAWSDVARRVAHEIKNPLTPITLAADRLRKKYLPQITQDADNYVKYIETISKNVGDIGKMVEEFVSFARMPAPVFNREDISSIIRKIAFSEQVAHPAIAYKLDLPETPVELMLDEGQISRLFTNLLKNAAEAIESLAERAETGAISVKVSVENEQCLVEVKDNGPGFPPDSIHKVMEPYVTTRTKGTGLGLAIVRKITEEHKAQIRIENLPGGGGAVYLCFFMNSDINASLAA